MTNASSGTPFPPTFALSVSRALYPDITGTVALHSGWPILAGRRLRSHRRILRSELANWVSSSFEIGIGGKQWNAVFEIKGATRRGLLAVHRNFRVSDTTTVQIGTSVDPLLFPAALSLTVEATQNWRDLVSGGLSIGLSIGFSLGGILLRIKYVRSNTSVPCGDRSFLSPQDPGCPVGAPDSAQDQFAPEPRLVLRGLSVWELCRKSNVIVHRLVRGGETLVIPIKLTDELRLDWMLIATFMPTLALVSSEFLLLRSAHRKM